MVTVPRRAVTPVPRHPTALAPGHLWSLLGSSKGKPFRPFPAQYECLSTIKLPWPGMVPDSAGRLVPYPTIFGVNCGRRLGKTTMAEVLAWQGFLAPDDFFGPPTVRITADTFNHGQKIWDRFVWHAENTELSNFIASHERGRFLITGKNGATIQLLSADNPQTLAGDGVTLWLVDEAQYLTYAAWENLFPSTAERDGVIAMFGVSEGDGPYREICYKGDDPDQPEYKRLCYPTAANPFVPRWRIEFARRQYTPTRFKQLYLAQWDEDTGKVFRNVDGCIDPRMKPRAHPKGWGEIQPPLPGHDYYGGLDLALYSDWCVYTISDRDGNLVAWDRFNGGSWELLKARVFELSKHYRHPVTWVDSTGSGDPIFEDLQRRGMNVLGYKIGTNEKKRQLVDECAVRIGAGQMRFPDIKTMTQELRRFEATRTDKGVLTYQAPKGLHDDFVIALSLTCQGLPRPIAPSITDMLTLPLRVPDIVDRVAMQESGVEIPYDFDPVFADVDEEINRFLADQQQIMHPQMLRARSEADYI